LPNKAYETLITTKKYESEQIEKSITENIKTNKEEEEEEEEDKNDNILEEISEENIIYLLFKELIQR